MRAAFRYRIPKTVTAFCCNIAGFRAAPIFVQPGINRIAYSDTIALRAAAGSRPRDTSARAPMQILDTLSVASLTLSAPGARYRRATARDRLDGLSLKEFFLAISKDGSVFRRCGLVRVNGEKSASGLWGERRRRHRRDLAQTRL